MIGASWLEGASACACKFLSPWDGADVFGCVGLRRARILSLVPDIGIAEQNLKATRVASARWPRSPGASGWTRSDRHEPAGRCHPGRCRRKAAPAPASALAALRTRASATVYLAQEIGIDTLLGCTVLASLARGRPFASWFAGEIFPLPQEMRESDTFQRAMRTITAVWGLYFLARAIVRVAALLTLSTDSYALVIALSDAPFLIAILAWSVYHTASAFRNSARWAPVIAAAETSQA